MQFGETIPPKIDINGVSLRYAGFGSDGGSNLALDRVSFRIAQGEFVAIIGPSGCGKSSLLRLVSGLFPVTEGTITLDGKVVRQVPPGIGFLFQSDALLPWKTAIENVAIGAMLAGHSPRESRERARSLLEQIGLGSALDKYPSELSGGMRKRVALSRTMAYEPTVFLLDEPFSALDAQTRIHVGNGFLKVLESLGQTVMFVTHDIDEAIALADRVVVMTAAPGRIAAEFPIDLPRPRDYYRSRMESGFRELQERIWDVLRHEMQGVLSHEGQL
jgi:NitT/TauT family transport system ATP-binding protein